MPFGIIGRTGPGMRQLVGFEDRSTGMGTFGANLGRAVVTNGDVLSQRRGPLPKLLWADLLYNYSDNQIPVRVFNMFVKHEMNIRFMYNASAVKII